MKAPRCINGIRVRSLYSMPDPWSELKNPVRAVMTKPPLKVVMMSKKVLLGLRPLRCKHIVLKPSASRASAALLLRAIRDENWTNISHSSGLDPKLYCDWHGLMSPIIVVLTAPIAASSLPGRCTSGIVPQIRAQRLASLPSLAARCPTVQNFTAWFKTIDLTKTLTITTLGGDCHGNSSGR